uniref:Putative secreted protein n=1 Tax=Ixodes ricinus TaxID=34613 RepID=A0A6B0UTY8_IXORI
MALGTLFWLIQTSTRSSLLQFTHFGGFCFGAVQASGPASSATAWRMGSDASLCEMSCSKCRTCQWTSSETWCTGVTWAQLELRGRASMARAAPALCLTRAPTGTIRRCLWQSSSLSSFGLTGAVTSLEYELTVTLVV